MTANLIQYDVAPVKGVLDILLQDKTTGRNIIFATQAYAEQLPQLTEQSQITSDVLFFDGYPLIQPRVSKSQAVQDERTRHKAEVFTPSWTCNHMNNHCDEDWFGRPNVFNIEHGQSWTITLDRIDFEEKSWKKYVDSRRLEITCGEAPYIVSRYDTTTGDYIPVERRIGILDRKLRVINENTYSEKEWLKWTIRAFQSVYGYEFQGDNLLIARINLLMTFCEYLDYRWHREASSKELKQLTNIIAWNFWQMDGINGTVPFTSSQSDWRQLDLFNVIMCDIQNDVRTECLIHDWRSKKTFCFKNLHQGGE